MGSVAGRGRVNSSPNLSKYFNKDKRKKAKSHRRHGGVEGRSASPDIRNAEGNTANGRSDRAGQIKVEVVISSAPFAVDTKPRMTKTKVSPLLTNAELCFLEQTWMAGSHFAELKESKAQKWPERLGHLNFQDLLRMVDKGLADIVGRSSRKVQFRFSFSEAKQRRRGSPRRTRPRP